MKKMFKIGLHVDVYEPVSFKVGMMIDMTKLYIMSGCLRTNFIQSERDDRHD